MLERFAYEKVVAAAYIGALFIQIMDGTIINVALKTLAAEFEVDATAMDWTVLSFGLALGVMTASAGWLGDKIGLKPTFLWALGGFIFASVLCGSSQSLNQLVASRALQGAFAGMITPIGSALLFNAFPIEQRSVASRKVITVAVIAPALGPIVGGLILEYVSWRWIFLINVPIGLLAFALAFFGLRKEEPVDAGRFDIAGFVLAGVGLSSFIYGISRGGQRGWGSPIILVSLLGGVLLLALLVKVELGQTQPLLAFRLAKDRLFSTCNLLAVPVYAGFLGAIYLLPLFLQDEAGKSPLEAGLAVFPQPLGVLIMSQLTGRWFYKRFGPRRLLFTGNVLALLTGLVIATIDAETSLWTVRGLMLARGLAMGLIFIPIQAAVYASIDRREMSRATAIYSTTRQVAPAIGVAVASTVLASRLIGTVEGAPERVGGYQLALLVTALFFGLAAVISLWIRDEDAAATMAH